LNTFNRIVHIQKGIFLFDKTANILAHYVTGRIEPDVEKFV